MRWKHFMLQTWNNMWTLVQMHVLSIWTYVKRDILTTLSVWISKILPVVRSWERINCTYRICRGLDSECFKLSLTYQD